jgi:hypothetical protein
MIRAWMDVLVSRGFDYVPLAARGQDPWMRLIALVNAPDLLSATVHGPIY